ncbi:MAG: hypothetical protein AAF548_02995 [Actinomycetota bacterium]
MCTGAVGALSHYIERAGVATASISLVREQTERVRPPRALWVPFPLGRPLGVPGDADFQLDVMRAALGMLGTATEPTIEDYPVDAPTTGPEPWACPLNLAVDTDDSLRGRLEAEVARLRPWATETRRTRGRTSFGLSGARPDDVDAVVAALATAAETGDTLAEPTGGIEWAHEMPFLLRHLAEDLRGYYHEAIAAQPGPTPPDHDALNDWIFEQTAFGDVLMTLGDHLTGADPEMNPFAILVRGLLIPEGRYRGESNFRGVAGYDDADS